jgi:DNA invertase Pin-like site-specific DNA recombinase
MPKCFSYSRVSSLIQLGEGKRGIQRQLESSRQWAIDNNMVLDESTEFSDLGISAYGNKRRAGFDAILNGIDNGLVSVGDYLIVESLDRITRQPDILEAVEIFLSIVRRGVVLVTLSDGQIYDKSTMDMTKLIISITVLSRAGEESEIKSMRISDAWEKKRNKNIPMTKMCPSWLVLSDDRSCYELIADRVEVVKRVFQMTVDGMGKQLIAKSLNDAGISWNRKDKANGFHVSYITKLLNNRAVIGKYTPSKLVKGLGGVKVKAYLDEIDNYYPSCIDESIFYAANRATLSRRGTGGKKGDNHPNLIQGLTKCSKCNSSMKLMNKGAKNGRWYICSMADRGGNCDNRMTVKHELVESMFLKCVTEIDFNSLLSVGDGELVKIESEILIVDGELDSKSNDKDKIIQSIRSGIKAQFIIDEANALDIELNSLNDRKSVLLSTLDAMRYERDKVNKIADIELLNNLTGADKEIRIKATSIIKTFVTQVCFSLTKSGKQLIVYLVDGDRRIIFLGADTSIKITD